jgi:hypothetical protein
MPDATDFLEALAPLSGLLDSLASDPSAPARALVLARLRRLQTEGNAHLRHHAEELENLYREAKRLNSAPEELAQAAAILAEKERAAAEILAPGIEKLRHNLAIRDRGIDAELRQAFRAPIDIARAWLALYLGTRKALLILANPPPDATGEPLRARPIKGETDYAELIRDTIAKFPKILAALAK